MTIAIRKGFNRPEPFPFFDLFGTPWFTERVNVVEKIEGEAVSEVAAFGTYSCTSKPAYFIFVMTERGSLRLSVSKKVFDLLQVGDPVVVSYQQGRFNKGALEGKIAR